MKTELYTFFMIITVLFALKSVQIASPGHSELFIFNSTFKKKQQQIENQKITQSTNYK